MVGDTLLHMPRDKSHGKREPHGLTPEEARVYRAGKACALCGEPEKLGPGGHCVDHDHKTGKIRGVLCRGCNNRVAYLDNHPEWYEKALAYVDPD